MNKKYLAILFLLLPIQAQAISQYAASYELRAITKLGSVKVGEAKFKLLITENDVFTFTSKAFTDKIWKTLYDYSRYEKSIGFKVNNTITGTDYDLVEIQKNSLEKNNKIQINYEEGYATFNNEAKWKVNTKTIFDELNIYLALSEDVEKNPNQEKFSYQVIDEKGINLVNFISEGSENILIQNNNIDSIKFNSPELKLTLNVSKKYNYLPVIIIRHNKKNRYSITLKDYESLP